MAPSLLYFFSFIHTVFETNILYEDKLIFTIPFLKYITVLLKECIIIISLVRKVAELILTEWNSALNYTIFSPGLWD